MKKKFRVALFTLLFLAAIAVTGVFLGSNDIAILNPKGMIGIQQRDLLFTSSLLMLIVVIPVFIFTIVFSWKYRAGNKDAKYNPDWEHDYIAETLWWGVPFVIIVILAIMTWTSSHKLDPYRPIENGKKPVVIQAVALNWKWLFIYPEQGIATVNFIQFPEKTPINFEITADAPMNSFWIPQLGGQIYAMSAMRTKLHLIADEVGTFRGCSANISGKGFAGMKFTAQSSTEEDFEKWVDSVKGSKERLNFKSYEQLVQPSEYNPPAFYILDQADLFDQIIMKYTGPSMEM